MNKEKQTAAMTPSSGYRPQLYRVGCAVLSLVLSAATGFAVTYTVNCSSSNSAGPMTQPALGFLVGPNKSPALIPAEGRTEFLVPLGVKQYRCPANTYGGVIAAEPNATIILTLNSIWGIPTGGIAAPHGPWWGTARGTPNPGTYNSPNWSSWLDAVEAEVTAFKAAVPAGQRGYDFWNEPNTTSGRFWGWSDPVIPSGISEDAELADISPADGLPDMPKLKALWKITYQLFKGVGPSHTPLVYNGKTYPVLDANAILTGPGATNGITGNPVDFVQTFMTYCKNNSCLPTHWNWHFGGNDIYNQLKQAYDYETSIGIAHKSKMILEYLEEQDGKQPGRTAYELNLMTQGSTWDLTHACEASWPETQFLGNSLVDLGGGNFAKQGVWHVFDFYGNMMGNRVKFDFTGASAINWMASVGTQNVWVLLGSRDLTPSVGSVTLKFTNLVATGGTPHVTVRRIPYQADGSGGPGLVPALPAPILDINTDVSTLAATGITFNWGAENRDAYRVNITNVTNSN